MSTVPLMKADRANFKHVFIEKHSSNSLDDYSNNYSNLQSHVLLSNTPFPSCIESFQQNSSYVSEIDEWSQLFAVMINWQGVFLVAVFCALIVITIIGNTLVILAVITTKRLKTVTNCFVMSLAVADLLVGIFVMPPAVAVHLKGSWQLGWALCDIWISLDILLCTASILSLCAISVDRYLAVTQPLTYSRKRRSKRLALAMILIVWTIALAITCPPIFGWYESGRRDLTECRYNQNEGYVIFSAMGSFFIPMAVMIYVYARISCVVASRHDNMTDINIHNKKLKRYTKTEADVDRDLSEQDLSPNQKRQLAGRTLSTQTIAKELQEVVEVNENDLITNSGSHELAAYPVCTPSIKRLSSVTSKNSTSTEQQYSLSALQRHSIRHNASTTPYINDTYITRNIRVHHQKSLSNRISLLKKENKTTQTLSIVVGGFIACWLPFFICYLITPFLDEQQVSRTLVKVLTWLGWFNSAINPFIYAFYSVDFRAAFWRLTLKRFFRASSKIRYPSNTMSIRR